MKSNLIINIINYFKNLFTGHNVKKFLFDHIDVAFKKGFDDNIGRHSITVSNYFEVVKYFISL